MKNALGEFQNILLLGGRSEIGVAIAQRVASGFTKRILLAGRNMTQQDIESVRSGLAKRNLTDVEVSVHEFDATDSTGHRAFIERLGGEAFDLAIIAFGQLGQHEEMMDDPALAADLVAVNMAGVVSSGLACASALARRGQGHMLFVSSVAAVRTRRSNFIYGSTKAGMDAFAQGLSDAMVSSGVGVTIVRPGFVRTAMTAGIDPAPFATTAGDVADRVAEGMRRGKGVIWAPGVLRYIFSVMRVLPTPIWRRLPIN